MNLWFYIKYCSIDKNKYINLINTDVNSFILAIFILFSYSRYTVLRLVDFISSFDYETLNYYDKLLFYKHIDYYETIDVFRHCKNNTKILWNYTKYTNYIIILIQFTWIQIFKRIPFIKGRFGDLLLASGPCIINCTLTPCIITCKISSFNLYKNKVTVKKKSDCKVLFIK